MQRFVRLLAITVPLAFAATGARADVTISSGTTHNMSCSGGVCAPTAATAVLNAGDLQTLLASGNVEVTTTGSGVQANNIAVEAAFSWSTGRALTLDAYQSIAIGRSVTVGGLAGLTLTTNDGGTGGTLSFGHQGNVTFASLSSSLTINGTAYTLVSNIASLATDVAGNPAGFYALAGNYNAAPDGTYPSSPIATTVTGTIQGLGNVISNLSVSNTWKRYAVVGLFAAAGSTGTIANINLQKMEIAASGTNALVGGLVGNNQGFLFGDHVAGTVTGGAFSNTGGIAGDNEGSVTASSSSAGTVASMNSSTGSLAGYNAGAISASYSTGAAKAGSQSAVGGLVGDDEGGMIANSYSMGAAEGGTTSNVGGVIGTFDGDTIGETYATGRVTGDAGSEVGGFLGQQETGTISSSYWDTTTSKTKDAQGGSSKLAGVKGLTTKKFRSGLPTGFDTTIWAEGSTINKGLPYLIANPPPK